MRILVRMVLKWEFEKFSQDSVPTYLHLDVFLAGRIYRDHELMLQKNDRRRVVYL